jgi:capsular exopolysaccharide synthesis family protein
VALMLEFADRRLKDEDSIERAFGLPLLGTIPRTRRRGTASQADHEQREAFGLLAANLHASPAKYDTHVIMVTSASPSEGKTSVTLGLARAFARLGKRVIVIEADLRRPTLPSFPVSGQSGGLTSILAGTGVLTQELVWLDAETLEPVTLDDARDGLSFAVLPAGTLPPNPQRLLSTPTMATVVEVARSLADVVLIDTPPVAAVNDAVSLLPVVDDVLLIARLNVTTKDAVRKTLRIVGALDINLAGVAVTDVPVSTSGYGYYAAAPAREAPAEPAPDEMPRDSTARV